MFRSLFTAGLVMSIVAAMGCTGVQKGTAAGSALGSGAGAMVGHATSAGSGPGAILGFGVGAIGGAIAGEHYYDEDDGEALGDASDTIERLTKELRSREARLAQMSTTVEQEKAQQRALLEAYEKARSGQRTLSATTVEPDKGEEIKYTLLAGVLFDSGSAKLSREGKAALKRTAQSIRSRYPDAEIEVRGHTDSVPIKHSSFKSNRALSQARATRTLRRSCGMNAV